MAVRITTEIDTAIITWIKSVLPHTTAVSWDKVSSQGSRAADKPALPYVSLNVISGPSIESGADLKKDAAVDQYTTSIIKVFTLSITYISNSDYLAGVSKLADSLKNPLVLQQLREDADLGVWDIRDALDVSEQLTTKYELRANMDVQFSYVSKTVGLELGEIHSTIIDPTYNGTPGKPITVDINNP